MFANPAVRLILQPLRKCMDAADRVDAWHDEHKEDIASSRAELGLSTEQTADQGKRVATDVERSPDTLDPFGLTSQIETVAANLAKAGFPAIGDQFFDLIEGVDENGGDKQIPMDAFRGLIEIHCPGPRTNDEAIYLGGGRVKIGDASVKLTRRCHVKSSEYLVKHRNADTKDLASCTSNPSIMMKQLFEIKGGLLAPFLTLPGKERKGEGYSTTIIDGRPKN